jgi:hypothetical protein
MKAKGIDPHSLKPKKGASKFELFKDKEGNVYVKLKNGSGPAEATGVKVGGGS